MSKPRSLADFVSGNNPLADGTIDVVDINGLTATAEELNKLDGATVTTTEINHLSGVTSAVQTQLDAKVETLGDLGVTATATELNYVDGVTSNIQTQFDNISVTSGSLTKSFVSGETASITLSQAISPAPVVSVTKEVPQTGLSSKGAWDVATDGANYDRHDTAYDTTLSFAINGYDLANASYDSVSFSLSGQDTLVSSVFFKPDGTKMFMVGNSTDTVYQYSLSTAWDVSTASYDSVSLNVSAQDGVAINFFFKDDGTKLYICGYSTFQIHQYTLSTAWDLSTASYDSVAFSVASQGVEPLDVAFNSTGSKMYVIINNVSTIYQYSLSTPWDVSTASYDSVSFNTTSQDGTPYAIALSSDDTKFFISGFNNSSIYRYTLATPSDLSSISYDSVSFNVGGQEASVRGIFFKPSGEKMYIAGGASDTVHQYSTGTVKLALGSGSFASTDVGKTIVGNGGEAILTATDGSYNVVTAFNDNSTIAAGSWSMYALTFDATNGVEIGGIAQGGAYNITSASAPTEIASGLSSDLYGFTFNNDGTRVLFVDNTNILWTDLSTPYDLSTRGSFSDTGASGGNIKGGPTFSANGLKYYHVDINDERIYETTLSTAYVPSSATSNYSILVSSQDNYPYAVRFNPTGTIMTMLGRVSGSRLFRYNLSTGFDLGSQTYSGDSRTIPTSYSTYSGAEYNDFVWNDDGTKLFAVDIVNNNIVEFTLGSPYDISGSFTYSNVLVKGGTDKMESLSFTGDGKTVIGLSRASRTFYVFDLETFYQPTAAYHPAITNTSGQISTTFWTDINNMTADQTANDGQVYYAVSTDGRTTWSVAKATDGVRPIVRNNAGTWEYNSNEPTAGFIIDGATQNYKASLGTVGTVLGLTFNNDGTKGYVTSYDNGLVYEYNLSTPYDFSAITFVQSFTAPSGPVDTLFNPTGTKMYIAGSTSGAVLQYSLSTPYDISTATYDSVSLSLSAGSSVRGITFGDNGTKLYDVNFTSNVITQYNLSTAYDLSTATAAGITFTTTSQAADPVEIQFNTDGTKMFVADYATGGFFQYSLSTAWDVSTATYDNISLDVTGNNVLLCLTFTPDGQKMYFSVSEGNPSYAYEYDTSSVAYTTSATWTAATTNDEMSALQQALTDVSINRMDKTQLDAIPDGSHFTLGDSLDLMIALYLGSNGTSPTSDGVSINYDAQALNQGAVLGTDYDYDFPDSTTVRITSNAAQNLKIRVV